MEILDAPKGNYVGKPVLLHFDVHCNKKNSAEWLTEKAMRKEALATARSIIPKRVELSSANAILFGEYSYTIYNGSPSTIIFASTIMAAQFFQIEDTSE